MAMFKLVDGLEFRLNRDVIQLILNPAVIIEAVENPLSITRVSQDEFEVKVRRLMGTKLLTAKFTSDGDGGTITCYDQGKQRWSYTATWSSLPGSATAQISFIFQSSDDGLKGRARRLLDELKAAVLNGRIEQHYSNILGYFKGEIQPQREEPPKLSDLRGEGGVNERVEQKHIEKTT